MARAERRLARRVGLVGTGFMGKAHASRYAQEGHVCVAMIASSSDEHAREAAARFGADAWTTDYGELVAHEGVVGVYGDNMRFSPALRRAKEIINQGGLGRPILFRATEIHNGPFHADWFWDAERAGGGDVIGMGIHGLYVAE